jgi:hypothetical protein
MANGWDRLILFRLQVIKIFVCRLAGVQLTLAYVNHPLGDVCRAQRAPIRRTSGHGLNHRGARISASDRPVAMLDSRIGLMHPPLQHAIYWCVLDDTTHGNFNEFLTSV